MSARDDVEAALTAALPDTYEFVDDLRDLDEPTSEKPITLQLMRNKLEPGKTQGSYEQEFDLWIVTGSSDPAIVEPELDAAVDDVLPLIDQIKWLTWSICERAIHPSNFHGYKITFRTSGNTTQ